MTFSYIKVLLPWSYFHSVRLFQSQTTHSHRNNFIMWLYVRQKVIDSGIFWFLSAFRFFTSPVHFSYSLLKPYWLIINNVKEILWSGRSTWKSLDIIPYNFLGHWYYVDLYRRLFCYNSDVFVAVYRLGRLQWLNVFLFIVMSWYIRFTYLLETTHALTL